MGKVIHVLNIMKCMDSDIMCIMLYGTPHINKRLNIQKEITEIHVNSESTESRITEDNDLILDTFSKYFASIFTKDDNNHLPTIDISPCKSEMKYYE